MKRIIIILCFLILLVGCSSNITNDTLPELKQINKEGLEVKEDTILFFNDGAYTYFTYTGEVLDVYGANKDNFFGDIYFYSRPKYVENMSLCKFPKEYTGDVYILMEESIIKVR